MKSEKILGIICWLVIATTTGIVCVNITKLDVPDFYVIHDENSNVVVLDCQYELQRGESNLVVKWQKDGAIIYQWIQGFKPKAFPHMKDQIDDTYEASNDSMQKYRALALKNPSWNTTGTYKCLVQTKQSAASQMKHLQIIDASNYTLELEQTNVLDDLEVKCYAENVYPQPKLKIRFNEDENVHIKTEEFVRNENGYFDVNVIGIFKNYDSTSSAVTCSMFIPNSNFSVVKTASINGTSSTSRISFSFVFIFTLLALIFSSISECTNNNLKNLC